MDYLIPGDTSELGYEYFKNRSISKEVIKKHIDSGVAEFGYINFHNVKHPCLIYQTRSLHGFQKRGKYARVFKPYLDKKGKPIKTFNNLNPEKADIRKQFFLFDNITLKGKDTELHVVEGDPDYFNVSEVLDNVVCIGGVVLLKRFMQELRENQFTGTLFLHLDNDTGGHTQKENTMKEVLLHNDFDNFSIVDVFEFLDEGCDINDYVNSGKTLNKQVLTTGQEWTKKFIYELFSKKSEEELHDLGIDIDVKGIMQVADMIESKFSNTEIKI